MSEFCILTAPKNGMGGVGVQRLRLFQNQQKGPGL